jgi:hypothetical protein
VFHFLSMQALQAIPISSLVHLWQDGHLHFGLLEADTVDFSGAFDVDL